MDFSKVAKLTGRYISDNAPAILTGIAVAGVVTTTVFGVKAGMQARDILEAEDGRRYEEALAALDLGDIEGHPETIVTARITPKEAFFLTWRPFVPAAIMGAATISCVVGANSINLGRQAALVSAVTLGEKAISQYQEKVLETVGEKKEQAIRDEVAKADLVANPVSENKIVVMGNGDQLCRDMLSGRYFESDIETIRRVQNDLNGEILQGDHPSLNEFYQAVGLEPIELGNTLGWNESHQLDIIYSSLIADNNRACITIQFRTHPVPEYYRYYR